MKLLRGNGCCVHDDCFTCPLPDCYYNYSNGQIAKKWKKKVMDGLKVVDMGKGHLGRNDYSAPLD